MAFPDIAVDSNATDSGDQTLIGRTLEVDTSDPSARTDPHPQSPDYFSYDYDRGFEAYPEIAFHLPRESSEAYKLDLQHQIWLLTLNGALHISPLPETIHNVLDIGTGTGIWACQFAEKHPSAQVIGTDRTLSLVQTATSPPNCRFEKLNVEEDWTTFEGQQFDFIHGRMIGPNMHDWPSLFQKSWDHLAPGGYLEIQEVQTVVRCDDHSATEESSLVIRWSQLTSGAAARAGNDPLASNHFPQQLRNQGFGHVKTYPIQWPIGTWPKGGLEKDIGRFMVSRMLRAAEEMSVTKLMRRLDWSREEVEALIEDWRDDIQDPNRHFYVQV